MLLEKSENLLKLSVKQLVIQSKLPSSISVGQAVWCAKNQMLILFVTKFGILVPSKSYSSLTLIQFRLKG